MDTALFFFIRAGFEYYLTQLSQDHFKNEQIKKIWEKHQAAKKLFDQFNGNENDATNKGKRKIIIDETT